MDPSVAFSSARVILDGLVADIVSRVLLNLTCYFEEHLSLVGIIISRLYNDALVGLIYELLFLS